MKPAWLTIAIIVGGATAAISQSPPPGNALPGCVDQVAELAGKLARLGEPNWDLTGFDLFAKAAPLTHWEAERAADRAAMLVRAKMKGKTYEDCRLYLIWTRAAWLCPMPKRRETSFLGEYDAVRSDEAWKKRRDCEDAYFGSLAPEDAQLVEAAKNTPEALFNRCSSSHSRRLEGKEVSQDEAGVCAKLTETQRAEAEAQGKKWAEDSAKTDQVLARAKELLRSMQSKAATEAAEIEAMRNHPDCLQPTIFGCRRWREPRTSVSK
jgi:hypothetical protein